MFKIIPNKMTLKDGSDPNEEYLIKLNNVVKAYKTDAGDFLALKNINLSLRCF